MEDKKDKHLAHFLREIDKVKKPIGGNVEFRRMVQRVEKLTADELPVISAFEGEAPESWRRIAALHREKARQAKGGVYELSCRDAANALEGWDFRDAFVLNDALVMAGVIAKAENGAATAGKQKGVATKWRYLLPLEGNEDVSRNGAVRAPDADDDDNIPF